MGSPNKNNPGMSKRTEQDGPRVITLDTACLAYGLLSPFFAYLLYITFIFAPNKWAALPLAVSLSVSALYCFLRLLRCLRGMGLRLLRVLLLLLIGSGQLLAAITFPLVLIVGLSYFAIIGKLEEFWFKLRYWWDK